MSPYIFSPSLFLFHRPFSLPSPLPAPHSSSVRGRETSALFMTSPLQLCSRILRKVCGGKSTAVASFATSVYPSSFPLSFALFFSPFFFSMYVYIYIIRSLLLSLSPILPYTFCKCKSCKYGIEKISLSFFLSFLRRRKSHWIKFRKIETTEWNIGKRIEGGSESECAMDFGGKMAR